MNEQAQEQTAPEVEEAPVEQRARQLLERISRDAAHDPEAYLRHILSILPEWPSNRVDELLPWNVVLTNK